MTTSRRTRCERMLAPGAPHTQGANRKGMRYIRRERILSWEDDFTIKDADPDDD